jgi:hypothetical protein
VEGKRELLLGVPMKSIEIIRRKEMAPLVTVLSIERERCWIRFQREQCLEQAPLL